MCCDGLGVHGWPVIGALSYLRKEIKYSEVYNGEPPFAEQFKKHGDIFRVKIPSKFNILDAIVYH